MKFSKEVVGKTLTCEATLNRWWLLICVGSTCQKKPRNISNKRKKKNREPFCCHLCLVAPHAEYWDLKTMFFGFEVVGLVENKELVPYIKQRYFVTDKETKYVYIVQRENPFPINTAHPLWILLCRLHTLPKTTPKSLLSLLKGPNGCRKLSLNVLPD